MDEQERVAEFVATHDVDAPPVYRLLDLLSEVGELAKDANESTDYGSDPGAVELSEDELGDALFALLALCDRAGVDSGDALETALAKYERRLSESDTPGSGE
ncbi:nucleotide pyrophosphohydrolase [Halobacteriales archaeon QS_8_69_26]|nr:MAG: nucleotide pyrophosphohydrolase [Halobacteriales archaeon QS_8_69_26]